MEENLLEKKQVILEYLIYFLEEGGDELSLAEKLLIKKEIDNYTNNYINITKEDKFPLYLNTIYFVYKQIEKFGFKIDYFNKFEKQAIEECKVYADEVKLLKQIYGENVIYF